MTVWFTKTRHDQESHHWSGQGPRIRLNSGNYICPVSPASPCPFSVLLSSGPNLNLMTFSEFFLNTILTFVSLLHPILSFFCTHEGRSIWPLTPSFQVFLPNPNLFWLHFVFMRGAIKVSIESETVSWFDKEVKLSDSTLSCFSFLLGIHSDSEELQSIRKI